MDLEESASPRRRLTLLFRAYDDGAAFRYVLPEQESLGAFEIVKENTEFHFPADMKAWALRTKTFQHSYEGQYPPTTLGAIPETGMVCLPLTMQREDGVTLSITEADLTDYAGMYLRGLPGTALEVVLSPLPDGSGAAVRGKTPFSSPWRVLMVGDAPGRLDRIDDRPQPQPALRPRRRLLDQAGQGDLPLVAGLLLRQAGGPERARVREPEVLHRFRGGKRFRLSRARAALVRPRSRLHRAPRKIRYHQAGSGAAAAGAHRIREEGRRAPVYLGPLA